MTNPLDVLEALGHLAAAVRRTRAARPDLAKARLAEIAGVTRPTLDAWLAAGR